jgi:hypothetical protein
VALNVAIIKLKLIIDIYIPEKAKYDFNFAAL